MTILKEAKRLSENYGWCSPLHGPDSEGLYTTHSMKTSSVYSAEQMDELNGGDGGWWYETRNQVIKSMLQKYPVRGVLWDVGSGSGIVAKFLNENGVEAIGIEPNLRGSQIAASNGTPSICGVLQDLKVPDNSLAGVGMFDVLEHLEDRAGMLREIHRVLMPGGCMYLTLPALQALWSQFDVDAGHYLRYSKSSIRKIAKECGFEVESSKYFFLAPLPVVLCIRSIPFRFGWNQLVSSGEMLDKDIGVVGKMLTGFELLWSKIGFVGTSLFVVARKA